MSSKFKILDRETAYLLPPSIQDWLPEKHLARFVVEIVEQLDLSSLKQQYSSVGRKAYPVDMMLGLLFYGYITGVHSSRKIEQATYESVPFRYIAANFHPDHDSIAGFRKQFLNDLKDIFLQILKIASEIGILKMGKVSLDGSKIKANASKHKALSWEYANKLEQQLKNEIAELINLAEAADIATLPKDLNIPQELSRRNNRLAAIIMAKEKLEQRAKERFEKELVEYKEKIDQRKECEEKTGKKKAYKLPQPPVAGPRKNDQINLTDEESRIMPQSGGGFVQAYNAQACVDIQSMLIVENHLTQQTNDKLQIEPAIARLKQSEAAIGSCNSLLGDAGYFSKKNVQLCEDAGITPFIIDKRDRHNQSVTQRFDETGALPEDADVVAKMKHRLNTQEGKNLYAKRKTTVEPVFGIIKNVMRVKTFLLRGFKYAEAEWNLITIAWNIKRMFALQNCKLVT